MLWCLVVAWQDVCLLLDMLAASIFPGGDRGAAPGDVLV